MASNQDQEPDKPVVRVDQDSASDLQALFDSVLKPDSTRPQQVPLRMRKLPKSFFDPPATGSKSPSISHSRESSADSAFSSGSSPQVVHSRAHSSPATLQQTYEDQVPFPPGWEEARTRAGQVYYINHITRSTTWDDPRESMREQHQQQQQQPLLSDIAASLGPLPDGWEQATTPQGDIYFINHQTRSTSWYDPRIPLHIQRPQLPPNSWISPLLSLQAQAALQATQQNIRLQALHMERDRLKQRQQELMRQAGNKQLPMNPLFPGLTDHSRQESADSGLGLGNTYALPRNLEDLSTNPGNHGNNIEGRIMPPLSDDNTESPDELIPSLNVMLDDVQSIINPQNK